MELVWDAGVLIGIKIPMADQLAAHNTLFIRRGATEAQAGSGEVKTPVRSHVDARYRDCTASLPRWISGGCSGAGLPWDIVSREGSKIAKLIGTI